MIKVIVSERSEWKSKERIRTEKSLVVGVPNRHKCSDYGRTICYYRHIDTDEGLPFMCEFGCCPGGCCVNWQTNTLDFKKKFSLCSKNLTRDLLQELQPFLVGTGAVSDSAADRFE